MNEVESLALEAELEVAGTRGYSAYEIAKQHGFEGTEEEWLESLKGEDGGVGPEGPQGPPGITPDMRIGTVETLDPDEDAYANFIGTPAIPILNMGIPQGETGNGIASWTKTGTSGLVDTYTITYTDGTTTTLNVTNGKSIVSITKTTTSGLTDTYTITYNDNTTSTFYVQNGRGITTIDLTSTVDNVDTYTITYNDGTTSTFNVTNSTVTNQEFEALTQEVDKYKTLSKLLPKVEGEGTTVTLNDTVEGVTMDITPEGNTSQHTTTGKNLFQIKDADYTGQSAWQYEGGTTYTKLNNGYTLGTQHTSIAFQYDNLEVGENYTISFDVIASSELAYSSGVAVNAYIGHTETQYVKAYQSSTTLQRISWAFSAQATNRIAFRGGPITITNIQLEKGSTATDYEEYTGGQPSPSPSYPQPIKVVTGDNSIVIPRNNLFNPLQTYPTGSLSQNCNIELTNLAQGQTYYFYANEKAYLYVKIYKADGTLSRTVGSDTASSKKVNFTLTSNETKIIGTFYAAANYDVSTYDWTNVYISTIDSYEPYNPQTYPISLGNMELCSSPDKTLKDYIYGTPNNWYKYKYIQKVVYNGTEGWSKLVENTNTTQFIIQAVPGKAKGLYNAMSDLFKTYSGSIEEECITGQSNNTGLQIIINKTRANTKEDFKTWLSTHNVTAYYELNTPTQEQITDTTLIGQLNNLYNATSSQGTTYIICSSTSDSNETLQVKVSTYKDISAILNPTESEGE